MSEPREVAGVDDWRLVGGRLSAWFEAPSLTAGAALLSRVVELTASGGADGRLPDVDLRASGLRVRLGRLGRRSPAAADLELARSVSAAARESGLHADPARLQELRVAFGAVDTEVVTAFWGEVLGYDKSGPGCLVDPLRRDPSFSFEPDAEARPLWNRGHVDVSRPPEQVTAVKASLGDEAYGRWHLTLADAEGNEVDLVPGDPLGDGDEASAADGWRVVFGAMAFYATDSADQASDLVTVIAQLADEVGFPLLVDVRAEGVTLDSGKDQWEWEDDQHPAGARFTELAARIQAAARDRGLSADPAQLRFVQLAIDAVDVAAVGAFWTAALGYQPDPREHLADIYDPRRLNPVVIFQQMDASEVDRRRQRNRMYVELLVPSDQVEWRVEAALAAGGRLVADAAPSRRTLAGSRALADSRSLAGSGAPADSRILADPEGNELHLIATQIAGPLARRPPALSSRHRLSGESGLETPRNAG